MMLEVGLKRVADLFVLFSAAVPVFAKAGQQQFECLGRQLPVFFPRVGSVQRLNTLNVSREIDGGNVLAGGSQYKRNRNAVEPRSRARSERGLAPLCNVFRLVDMFYCGERARGL